MGEDEEATNICRQGNEKVESRGIVISREYYREDEKDLGPYTCPIQQPILRFSFSFFLFYFSVLFFSSIPEASHKLSILSFLF